MKNQKVCFPKGVGYVILSAALLLVLGISYFYFSDYLLSQKKSTNSRAALPATNVHPIMNGTQARENEFPYFVHLKGSDTTTAKGCGGSLIGENYVLTAAHCFFNSAGVQITNDVQVLIGVTSYSNLYTGHYITTIRPKSDLFVHPNFVPQSEKNFNDHDYLDTKTDSYDIALIKLHDKVKDIPTLSFFGSTVDINKTYMNTVVTIVGLGSTTGKDGTSPVSRLMKANIPIASYLFAPVKSNLIYLNSNNHNPFNSFVGQSVCTGDSGGPAILINNGKSYVVGVTMGGNCELKDSFYTSVSSLATWITTMTGIQPNSGTAMAPAITPYPTTFPLCASNQLNTEKECNRYLPNGICEWDGSTKTCGFVGKPHIVIPSKTFSQ